MELQSYNKIASVIYNTLVRFSWLHKYRLASGLWRLAWRISYRLFKKDPVRTTIHGYGVVVNYGHVYPVSARRFRSLNNPLIELVYQSYCVRKNQITIIDIGANVGDTILLLYSNCSNMVKDFICIDGDPEFFVYLQNNLKRFHAGKLILALLSSTEGQERALIRTHTGTSSAQGETRVQASTLDSILLQEPPQHVDVLKIDVDGFDGRVLQGAKHMLEMYRPAVIFEWHPPACVLTGNNWIDHFEALENSGYTTFIWFTKYGDFSHVTHGFDRRNVDMLAEVCIHSRSHPDWHYDVIALHASSQIPYLALAELAFARARKSKY